MDANNVFVGAHEPHIFNNDANPIDAANLNNVVDPNNIANPNNVADPNNMVINHIIHPNNFFHGADGRQHVAIIDENNDRLEPNNAEQNPQPNMIPHL